ncbi:MAG: hypothetical protein MJ025_00395 [Victivallaceae bacterium]|nr:hypothetical protein [Victivallaceae bacterium]
MTCRSFLLSCLAGAMLLAIDVSAAPGIGGLKKKMPKFGNGKVRDKVMVFNGDRPWAARDMAWPLSNNGIQVAIFSGEYLAGFSGASIKQHMSDAKEPKPYDGFTPAFATMAKKGPGVADLVLFNNIKSDGLASVFNAPGAVEQLRTYVESGGNLLFTACVPAGTRLDALLPVTFEDEEPENPDDDYFATRPEGRLFSDFPKSLPVYEKFRICSPVADAKIKSWICVSKTRLAPYIVSRRIGKGSVTYWNIDVVPANRIKCFSNWAYSKAFIAAVCGDCYDSPAVRTGANLLALEPVPERVPVKEATVEVFPPEFSVTDAAVSGISGDVVEFGNGCRMRLDRKTGSVDLFVPGLDKPYVSNLKVPILKFSNRQPEIDPNSNEYTGDRDFSQKADIKWSVRGLSASGNEAVITYVSDGNEMKWHFKAGTFNLDGREFRGIAERVELFKSGLLLSAIEVEGCLTPPKPLFARRNSCYSPPRGYSDFDMTGKTKSDTWTWKYFGSGQPFEMLVCGNGVYLGNVTEPMSTFVRLKRNDAKTPIFNMRNHNLGRVHAPVSTPFYWHWYSTGPERGHNDYLAMYQYVRSSLRRQAGLEEWTGYPAVVYNWQMTAAEKEFIIDATAKAGFRSIYPPFFESPIESINSPKRLELYKHIRDKGLGVLCWSAGSYTQGENNWIVRNHPEWMCRNEKGGIHTYPGNYCVIDVNNPGFFEWYKKVVSDAVKNGVTQLYRDMDGAAAMQVNYGLKESPDGVKSQIKFYRYIQDLGCKVSIEGMNPLVIDEYWLRADKYTSFVGNEFSMVGQNIYGDVPGCLNQDSFRMGMYNCFPIFEYCSSAIGFDRVPGEVERGRRYAGFVPKFNAALDNTGMPYVRETSFGTTWIGEKGGALFFWNPADRVEVKLPEGWKIKGVVGNVLSNVKGDSIYLLEKK